ncbi:hypothetical protein GCM10009641_03750 [Mycobacterium cookii]|uniref:SAM-dependent methyltransferase n=1 Tax=Mycobacterium cookii TaxID=1775 RepID=A0A7I7L3K9_9MYCO|nr:hypothetical protein [Mycobacterium cookii]BBX48579.1 hypothetical protein MCOO_45940 [Mycobacterium cookii]
MTHPAPEAFRHYSGSYESLYRGGPAFPGAPAPTAIPWDIRQAQPRLMELEALGAITGQVLDAGCGLGDNAIYLDTLQSTGWHIDFLGPATFVCNAAGFTGSFGKLPETLLEHLPPGLAGQMRQLGERMATIVPLLDDGLINLPCNVVHATKANP